MPIMLTRAEAVPSNVCKLCFVWGQVSFSVVGKCKVICAAQVWARLFYAFIR